MVSDGFVLDRIEKNDVESVASNLVACRDPKLDSCG